ncbi:MAG TPA: RsmE family RNA methyltransferase [Opitutaceae bacterium]
MNLILFEPGEIGATLPPGDPRTAHLLKVLKRKTGERFDAGVVNGPRGKGTITSIGTGGIAFTFERTADPQPADPIHILIALSRPQTARKILNEAASLGVSSIGFFGSEKGEASYASSTLWSTLEWRRHLVDGAAQAFDTVIPEVRHFSRVADAVAALPDGCARIALDNYEATVRMAPWDRRAPLALAFGPERGWSAAERTLLRAHGFELAHLGTRVLRTETAVVAAVAVAKAGM